MPRPRRRTKEEREEGKFVDHMMYLLTAPMLTWPGQESIYDWNDNKTTARMERLAHSTEILENEECTEFEAMIYISTSTLENAPGHDLYVVYGWLFKRWKPDQDVFPEHEIPEELNQYPQQEILTRVRKWIYLRQMNHLKTKLDIDQAAVEAEAQELQEQQGELF